MFNAVCQLPYNKEVKKMKRKTRMRTLYKYTFRGGKIACLVLIFIIYTRTQHNTIQHITSHHN